ncbi:MAG: PQQ-dependent sugar dehydrogenase, partial [Rubripirellula sp.]
MRKNRGRRGSRGGAYRPRLERLEDRVVLAVSFVPAGEFLGTSGGSELSNPTSLEFGPDQRLYVSQQSGVIKAFTIGFQEGNFFAAAEEELLLSPNVGVVQSIQNHNDDGSLNSSSDRQVTGLIVGGSAASPVLYITSSDPRIASDGDVNLDTNSGVITRVTKSGGQWTAVDIIRGLPRSEENHSNNGMYLSPDETKLFVTVGGNTNNGAPSQFFSYTGEYSLSGTVLEVDLADIESRPILTDTGGGQNGLTRQYVYDLPTLDDPSVSNNGVREDANGLDVNGPWGGNDGFNMAILPADAPMRIFADGFRNHYDLVMTELGKLYTVDNGSNSSLGGDPISVGGQATNQPNNGGTGDPEPLFLIEEGNYYGHPNPSRSNQDLAWTVYNDAGNPDNSVSPNSVSDLSSLVPAGVNIADGFIIDPSKFTSNAARLTQSGIRVPRTSPQSNTLVNVGSSSNGLVEYTGDAFDGELKGDLLVAQFNGNVGRLNLNAQGDAATYEVIPGLSGLSTPLDVTIGPNGSVWVAEVGGDFVKAFVPTDLVLPDDPDFDNDGIFNESDPFIRDASNGGDVLLLPGQTLLWDFDANQDSNLPGSNGYGGGLTGVMVNGTTDFEQFFQSPSDLPGQDLKLDNVKFITAAGGGTTVVEYASNGDASQTQNDGEFLFHTGLTVGQAVEVFTTKWSIYNPGTSVVAGDGGFTGESQQIGGYLGTGDQSNFLKIVAAKGPVDGFQIVLEEDDVPIANDLIAAPGLFDVSPDDGKKIVFELKVNVTNATALPTITYETASGVNVVSGAQFPLSGSTLFDVIEGQYTVQGQKSGLAVGLFSTNREQPGGTNAFQAIFDDVEITASGSLSSTPLYRVNAGGPAVASLDSGPGWSADTSGSNSVYLSNPGSNNVFGDAGLDPGPTVPSTVPGEIFDTERWDNSTNPEMGW